MSCAPMLHQAGLTSTLGHCSCQSVTCWQVMYQQCALQSASAQLHVHTRLQQSTAMCAARCQYLDHAFLIPGCLVPAGPLYSCSRRRWYCSNCAATSAGAVVPVPTGFTHLAASFVCRTSASVFALHAQSGKLALGYLTGWARICVHKVHSIHPRSGQKAFGKPIERKMQSTGGLAARKRKAPSPARLLCQHHQPPLLKKQTGMCSALAVHVDAMGSFCGRSCLLPRHRLAHKLALCVQLIFHLHRQAFDQDSVQLACLCTSRRLHTGAAPSMGMNYVVAARLPCIGMLLQRQKEQHAVRNAGTSAAVVPQLHQRCPCRAKVVRSTKCRSPAPLNGCQNDRCSARTHIGLAMSTCLVCCFFSNSRAIDSCKRVVVLSIRAFCWPTAAQVWCKLWYAVIVPLSGNHATCHGNLARCRATRQQASRTTWQGTFSSSSLSNLAAGTCSNLQKRSTGGGTGLCCKRAKLACHSSGASTFPDLVTMLPAHTNHACTMHCETASVTRCIRCRIAFTQHTTQDGRYGTHEACIG